MTVIAAKVLKHTQQALFSKVDIYDSGSLSIALRSQRYKRQYQSLTLYYHMAL